MTWTPEKMKTEQYKCVNALLIKMGQNDNRNLKDNRNLNIKKEDQMERVVINIISETDYDIKQQIEEVERYQWYVYNQRELERNSRS